MYSFALLSIFLVISFSTYIVCTTAQTGTCRCEIENDLNQEEFCRMSPTDANCPAATETCPCNCFSASDCPTTEPIACVLNNDLMIDVSDTDCNCNVDRNRVCSTRQNSGNICPGKSFCPCSARPLTGGDQCSNTAIKCVVAGGFVHGDPHFNGFDGSKFDFHGEHQHHYILFAQNGGDVLSARTKATNELYHGIKKTYFDEFGLLLCGASKKLKFEAAVENGQWILKVLLDGAHVTKDMSSKQFSISYPSKGRAVVHTERNRIEVIGVSMRSEFRRHLDFKIAKTTQVKKSDRFAGILGITLSHKLRQQVTGFPNNLGGMEPVTRENALRAHSEVGSLFPSAAELENVLKTTN